MGIDFDTWKNISKNSWFFLTIFLLNCLKIFKIQLKKGLHEIQPGLVLNLSFILAKNPGEDLINWDLMSKTCMTEVQINQPTNHPTNLTTTGPMDTPSYRVVKRDMRDVVGNQRTSLEWLRSHLNASQPLTLLWSAHFVHVCIRPPKLFCPFACFLAPECTWKTWLIDVHRVRNCRFVTVCRLTCLDWDSITMAMDNGSQ